MGILGKLFGGDKAPASQLDEQNKLIHWKGEEGSADWTISDSFEGVQVFGDTGSGKSSASAKLLATALLRAGYGGLVLTVKKEDLSEWLDLVYENNRTNDTIFFAPGGEHCFNFLEYELKHGVKNGLGSLGAAQILSELVSLAQRGAGRADDFWFTQSANQMISHTLQVIHASGETPN